MTRIELLQQKVNQLKEQQKFSNDVRRTIEKQKKEQLSKVYFQYFGDVLEEGDEIEGGDNSLKITRPKEGYNYNPELISLYFRGKDWREDTVDEIETSFYTTSDNSEFELRRMILIGKVGQVLLDFKDNILEAYNHVKDQFKDALSKQMKEVFGFEKEIKELENQIRVIEKENLLEKVEKEGIEFELPEGKDLNYLPNMDVKFDRTIYNIKGLQIVGKTKSGKSADLRLTTLRKAYKPDSDIPEIKEEIQIVEKVRMDKIEQFLQFNSDQIVTS